MEPFKPGRLLHPGRMAQLDGHIAFDLKLCRSIPAIP